MRVQYCVLQLLNFESDRCFQEIWAFRCGFAPLLEARMQCYKRAFYSEYALCHCLSLYRCLSARFPSPSLSSSLSMGLSVSLCLSASLSLCYLSVSLPPSLPPSPSLPTSYFSSHTSQRPSGMPTQQLLWGLPRLST